MAEHDNNNDPCEEVVESIPEPGQPVEPDVEDFIFDPPIFPEVETEFEGIPTSRSCIVVPRHLYYSQRAYINYDPYDRRDIADTIRTQLNANNPLPAHEHDVFRFVMGKVYDFSSYRNGNYFFNEGFTPNENKKIDFALNRIDEVPTNSPQSYWEKTAVISLSCSGKSAEFLFPREAHPFRLGEHPLAYPTVVDYYKGFTAHEQNYVDTSFRAPAAFFAKESDGLNITLPETVSIQTFIPNMLTFSDTRADYANLYEESTENPLLKKSIYERYSAEFAERPYYCEGENYAKVHKFPAEQVQVVNQISSYCVPQEGQQQRTSFQNIFETEYKFYNKISFDIKKSSKIAEKLKEYLLDSLVLGILDTESPSKGKIYTQFLNERIQSFQGLSDNDGVSANTRPNSWANPFYYLERYINPDLPNTLRDRLKPALDPSTYPLSFNGEEFWQNERDGLVPGLSIYSLTRFGNTSIFNTWLKEYLKSKSVSFTGLMKGALSHSEVIAYRLEKRDAQTDEVLQNFYFFNDPDTETIDFIDTQINFGAKYRYAIYAVNFVCGLEYSYDFQRPGPIENNISFPEEGQVHFGLRVNSKPTYWMIESPYHQQDILVLDAPPLSPDVTFLPWETLSENLGFFWFTPRLGQTSEMPIQILETDNETMQRMREAQNVGIYRNQEISYKSDSDPTHYQMFVLEDAPLSYQDFAIAHFEEATINAPTLLVRFQPNKNYYLTFRARDLGGISNPTKVFRYRINSFGDGIQHEIEEYVFNQTAQHYLMQFDQIIEVEPSSEQTAINFSNSENYSDKLGELSSLLETTRGLRGLSLGLAEDKIWGKTFVFEIISAETGKTIKVETSWRQIVEEQDGYSLIESEEQALQEAISEQRRLEESAQCMTNTRASIYRENENKSNLSVGNRIDRRVEQSIADRPTRAGSNNEDNGY